MREQKSPIARIAALGALLAAIVLVLLLLFSGGGDKNTYKLLFETGGQLVTGNEVRIGGVPVGSVEKIDLTDDNQAEVTITTEDPLTEGTEAVIRQTSLSGIANRYISITPGPNNADELSSTEPLPQQYTVAPVDIDQLFDTFRPRARRALQQVIEGQAGIYVDRGPEANRTYKFFNPGLSSTEKLFAELTRDEKVFTDFIVDTGEVTNSLASRRGEITDLVSNANEFLGAIAQENSSLDRLLVALPPALRQSNTTFVNLRATLDDLDPFVAAAKRSTTDLPAFLRDLRPVAERSIPVFNDLGHAVYEPGPANDLARLAARLAQVRAGDPRRGRPLDRRPPGLARQRPVRGPVRAGPDGVRDQVRPGDRRLRRQRPLRPRLAARDWHLQHQRRDRRAHPAAGEPALRPARPDPEPVGLPGRRPRRPRPTAPTRSSPDGFLQGKCDPNDIPPG